MARILLLTLIFPPDGVSTSVLMGDLSTELRALGHDITVLTATPHYNKDAEAVSQQRLYSCWSGILYESNFKGIPVYHASMPRKGDKLFSRALDYFRFHLITVFASIIFRKKYDLILAPSPPLTIGLEAWFLGLLNRAPFVYNVQEIYPDIAIRLGLLHNNVLIQLLKKMEMFIYNRARVVVVISKWFRRRLILKGVPNEKLRVIPNFVDTEFMVPQDRKNHFSATHGLENKFVVLYAGNIGMTQDFESLFGSARLLTELKDLCFLIVGDGVRREWLQQKMSEQKIPNIKLLPYQDRSVVPSIYATSDICLVTLKRGMSEETFPSKIYSIMAVAKPVIVAADSDSELTWVTHEAGCGWAIRPDDPHELAKRITYAYHNRSELVRKGNCGRRYAEKHHSRRPIAERYDKMIRDIVSNR